MTSRSHKIITASILQVERKKYSIKYSSHRAEFADLEQWYNALNILHSRTQTFPPLGCYLILVLLLLPLFTVCFVFVTVHTRNCCANVVRRLR
jgi:hypothetical protein